MSIVSFIVIGVLFAIGLLYLGIKRKHFNDLNTALKNQDYDRLISLCEMKINQRLIGKFNCDLYRINAIANKGNVENWKSALLELLDKEYNDDQKIQVLEIYYNIFLDRKDKEFCEKLLEYNDSILDLSFRKYNQWSYEVIFNHRTDLISEMDACIENNEFKGFGLGVVAYMIGVQYYYLDDLDMARNYFYTCIGCFSPKSTYAEKCKNLVDDLSDKIDLRKREESVLEAEAETETETED